MAEKGFRLAVIMERKVLANKWADFQWEAVGILPDGGFGPDPRLIHEDEQRAHWLHAGFDLELFTDEAEFYFANITAPEPRVFILWRLENEMARPALVTVSTGVAARMMDAGEQVDGVPMPEEIRAWVAEFVAGHYKPEARKKGGRYASSKLNANA
ncbi:MAG: DUF3305 domain-containing protein [Betaproteobacteria bacterium]|jgi:hypothetical protein|nr:DUF3305 domain-containing protein [Betaproteobacteria bacterium]